MLWKHRCLAACSSYYVASLAAAFTAIGSDRYAIPGSG
jgi:hypothetical protein